MWYLAGSLFKNYPFDSPTEAFSLNLFRQVSLKAPLSCSWACIGEALHSEVCLCGEQSACSC